MVLEHLEYPDAFFQEAYRVLKTGGTLIIHTPNALGYSTIVARLIPEKFKKKIISKFQDRAEADIFRAYYRANTQKILADLTKRAGFRVVNVKTAMSSPKFIMSSIVLYMELYIIKLFMTKYFRRYRTNIIGVIEK
jgi:ubiquinone/menaquinone biosynthesis C-methylase UbiE